VVILIRHLIGPLNIDLQPTTGGKNPNQIPTSGLAQTLVGQFGSLGRNVIRLNALVNSDNVTFGTGGSLFSLSAPSTFGYYTATDSNSRTVALIGRLTW